MAAAVGPYEIVRELERAPAARRLLARDSRSGTQVELRAFEPPAGAAAPATERARAVFLRESAILAGLEHPGLERVLDRGSAGGTPFLVAELVEGTPLDAGGEPASPLDPATAVALAADAADALACAHRAGVLHRDLRPSRLVRTGHGTVRVVGFGLGAVEETRGPEPRAEGDPGYFSPEQVLGGPLDPRSDLFSLCAVLHELSTGERPFPGRDASSVLYRIVHEPPADPTRARRPVGPALAAVLLRGLAKRPEERYPDGAALAAALRAAIPEQAASRAAGPPAGGVGVAPRTAAVTPRLAARAPAPARRARSRLPFVVSLLLAGALAGAAYHYRDRWLGASVPPPPVEFEATVRTEPPGLDVTLDGEPLAEDGRVRFRPDAGPALLAASLGCRTAEHVLDPRDAGGEVVLIPDPIELEWKADPGVAGAEVRVNGKAVGAAPVALTLDLCRDNRVELVAEGYRPATVEIAAGATPLDARRLLFGLALEPIPLGTLVIPRTPVSLVYYLDGRRVGVDPDDLELEEGEHELRYKNEFHFLEGRTTVRIRGGEATEPQLSGLALAKLTVQAFPSNCKVWVRRPGGSWSYVDETPASRQVALGRYEVKVVLNPTGETQIVNVDLGAGSNPPVRVSFGRRG